MDWRTILGRRITTECVRLVIDYAFSAELGLKELSANVFPENKASIRMYLIKTSTFVDFRYF
jgi:RimJ/RimL family protein N-acetyltransferase